MWSKRSERRQGRVKRRTHRHRQFGLESLEARHMLSGTPAASSTPQYVSFGDADLNGVVDNSTDYLLWLNGYTSQGSLGGWLYGDFDNNGVVDNSTDYLLWLSGYSQSSPQVNVTQLLSGHGRWLASFSGLEAEDELSDQTVLGQNLLHSAGISDEEIFVTSAVDLNGTFDLLTPAIATQDWLTEKLQAVPGFVGVHENQAYLTPLEGSFGTASGPDGDGSDAAADGAPGLAPGTWSQTTIAPGAIGTMMLLPNGHVMAQGGGVTNAWYQLTPDANGNYASGAWSSLASMGLQRLYFGSNILQNGKVFLVGGEYSGPSGASNWINSGEIYDPVANSWSPTATFPQSQFGDDPTEILPNGNILAGYL